MLSDPIRVISTSDVSALTDHLDQIEAEVRGGRYVAGYMSYEAGAAFDLATHQPGSSAPLAWFGVYPPEHVVRVRELLDTDVQGSRSRTWMSGAIGIGASMDFRLNVTAAEYETAIARIRDLIAAGDTYQVNYTCHARFGLEVDPLDYFLALVRSHPVPYAAYINVGDAQILSLSPELFLKRRGELIETRPMKGTRPRGRTLEEDEQLARQLQTSEKDRAENVMILDMMRNDLGRFCRTGSVTVPAMFTVEKYRSVWQMTSTATGFAPDASVGEVMAATFPPSSITGAPKRRTMEIIRELESEPRGVYTGVICLFEPGGDFTCSVAIRTLVHKDGEFDLGIGSGIVWDSDAQSEYEETLLKSSFAFDLTPDLRLFETLLLTEDRKYAHESEHIARIAESAKYWDFAFDENLFRARIREFAETAEELPLRVHAELDQEGRVTISAIPLPGAPATPVRVLLSSRRTDSRDRFLFHKTTRRQLYDQALEEAQREGFFEVMFLNQRGNVTEGSFTNLFAYINGEWVTSPISEGMLPGIWRDVFLRENGVAERAISLGDLATSEEVVIGNSVRGAIAVGEIVDEESGAVVWKAFEPLRR
ncbi:MAG: aminodeoxychorismate synthase component I [Armatimonadota bacterium]|nr:aminodeoxychorismate synthase component I [Armatimonadota bacterium]